MFFSLSLIFFDIFCCNFVSFFAVNVSVCFGRRRFVASIYCRKDASVIYFLLLVFIEFNSGFDFQNLFLAWVCIAFGFVFKMWLFVLYFSVVFLFCFLFSFVPSSVYVT